MARVQLGAIKVARGRSSPRTTRNANWDYTSHGPNSPQSLQQRDTLSLDETRKNLDLENNLKYLNQLNEENSPRLGYYNDFSSKHEHVLVLDFPCTTWFKNFRFLRCIQSRYRISQKPQGHQQDNIHDQGNQTVFSFILSSNSTNHK